MITCPKCGETMGDDLRFCPSCGTGLSTVVKVEDPAPAPVQEPIQQPVQQPIQQPVQEAAPAVVPAPTYQYNNTNNGYTNNAGNAQNVTFGSSVKNFVTKIVDFKGTTCKKEYWFGFLFAGLVIIATCVIDYIPFVGYVTWVFSAAACLGLTSMTVRRLRDLGKPWTRIFMYLIPVYGQILFFKELTK